MNRYLSLTRPVLNFKDESSCSVILDGFKFGAYICGDDAKWRGWVGKPDIDIKKEEPLKFFGARPDGYATKNDIANEMVDWLMKHNKNE